MVFYILWGHSPSFSCQSTVATLFAVFNLKRFYFSTSDALGIILVDAVFLRRRNAQLGSDRQIVGIGDYIFVVQVNVYPESVMSVEFAGNVAQICRIGNLERLFSLLALLLRLSRFFPQTVPAASPLQPSSRNPPQPPWQCHRQLQQAETTVF